MTTSASFTAKTASGDGVVARYGGSFVLAPSDSAVVDDILDLARAADPVEPGRLLPRKVAAIVAQQEDVTTLAVISALSDGLAVLLVGDVTMTLVDGTGTTTLSGRDATTWVDKIVRGPWSALTITLPGAGGIDRRSDLQAGVVAATGIELTSTGAPAAEAPEPVAPPIVVPPLPDLTAEEPVVAAPESGARSTIGVGAAVEEPAPEGGVVVQGIECSRQHFNDPTAIYCAVCGISMVHQTHSLVSGPRPPLGSIVLDDGTVHPLVGDFVLGREPENAPEVVSGGAVGLTLDDPDVTMSRVHVKLQLVEWDVRLVDAGSANGTYVAAPGETAWTKVGTGETLVLKPGTKVSLGGRTFVFDSHQKA
jgi:hypothetical protein